MSSIEPNQDALSAMAEQNPDEPVYMLNLLKYRDTAATGFGVDGMSGRDAYQVYGVNLPNSPQGSAANRYGWARPCAPLLAMNLGIQSFWCATPPGRIL